MKYLAITITLATLTLGTQAEIYTTTAKISKIRAVTEYNSATSAHHHIPFKVNAALNGGCTWLYITPNSRDAYSLLLAAKLADRPIGIQYSDAPSPWHAGTCQVQHIDLD